MGFHLHWSLPDYQIKLDKEFICTHLMKKVCLSVCTLTALALACTGQCCLSVCPYIGGNLPKVRSRYFPYGILPGPYFHSIPKGEMVFANLIFPMLNPHRQLCKYGPHLSQVNVLNTLQHHQFHRLLRPPMHVPEADLDP